MLSRVTRPRFLQWINDFTMDTRALFGNELSDAVQRVMEYMGLEHAGFVARPLYACTTPLEGGRMCMHVASMPKVIQHRDGRSHYRCTKCAESAPVSDSVPVRVLNLYILVRGGSKTTFMRRAAYTLRLRAPPPRWAWGVDLGELPRLTQANPTREGKFYDYNDAESEAIWCYSCSYEGKPQ